MEKLNLSIFDLSPIPMWIQDYSSIRAIFDEWTNQGISNLKEFLRDNPSQLLPYLATIKTICINQSTLRLYEANNLEEILQNFAKFHFEEITHEQIDFFVGLWDQDIECTFSAINYTCSGRQIDVQLRANVLEDKERKWDQVLLTTEDISASQNARRFAESLFLYSPTALWVKDYSSIKLIFDRLRVDGIAELAVFIQQHPDFVKSCFESIQNINVNQALLDLFKVNDKAHFFKNLWHIFRETSQQNFQTQLIALWNGQYDQTRECEYQTIEGDLLHIQEQLVIFPDSKHNWDTVQIALTDITERKILENHLLYMSKHDQLTQLYNRTFFNEEILRLQSQKIAPVSCIFLDINGLKEINDNFGHDHGDSMIQRFGRMLKSSIYSTPYSVSRIGGDEFVILMPKADQTHIDLIMNTINSELKNDLLLHPNFPIQVAIGFATAYHDAQIETLLQSADQMMYQNKQAFYSLQHLKK